ncbi:phosphatidylethanolamine-binding protein [Mycena albidolilacea]|uniref:Phosphatidylethanolamine-binding protein n=1 Tax=Mycena albidolilacea TaxID=1033008 RepID=A0AAD7E982_9AGAR|nr:phosphatidylethanolamine-binding protein [Mycena albidolilacea]
MKPIVEVTLSWLLKNAKGRDAKCFYNRPAFAKHPEQTIEVTSPDCGPTDAQLGMEYTADGSGRFPALEWTAPPVISDKVKQWLLVSEDPDAPLPTPIAHGIFGGIPPSKTNVEAKDFEIDDESKALLKGGFHYGVTRRGVPYIPPRPLMNHGPHRYFYEVIALGEPLDPKLLNSKSTREQIADAIVGKVLGWGMWVGSYERVWK